MRTKPEIWMCHFNGYILICFHDYAFCNWHYDTTRINIHIQSHTEVFTASAEEAHTYDCSVSNWVIGTADILHGAHRLAVSRRYNVLHRARNEFSMHIGAAKLIQSAVYREQESSQILHAT